MSLEKRPDGRYRVRWRDEQNVQHARHFIHKAEAARHDATVRADLARGTYVDARAGRTPFRDIAERWRRDRRILAVGASRRF